MGGLKPVPESSNWCSFYVLRPVLKPSSFKVHNVCLECREEQKKSFRWNTFVNDLERLGLLKLESSCAVLCYIGQLLTAVETRERKR